VTPGSATPPRSDHDRDDSDPVSAQRKRDLYNRAALAGSIVPAGVADILNRSRRVNREQRRALLHRLRTEPAMRAQLALVAIVHLALAACLAVGVLTRDGWLLSGAVLGWALLGVAVVVVEVVRARR
jgi:hypothetical protein